MGNRWYDQEPVMAKAMEALKEAATAYQAQVAINILKILVEHRIEEELNVPVETLTEQASHTTQSAERHRRWYDTDQSLSAALQLLRDCPPDLQKSVIPSVALMIEETLSK
jgi:hypothetical protein